MTSCTQAGMYAMRGLQQGAAVAGPGNVAGRASGWLCCCGTVVPTQQGRPPSTGTVCTRGKSVKSREPGDWLIKTAVMLLRAVSSAD
jgi:hypothetical protein